MHAEHKIGNVRYLVKRTFSGERIAADLIKARMVAAAKIKPQIALTDSPVECYNNSGNKSDQSNDKEAFH